MLLLLSLVTGLALSASGVVTAKETDPSQESFHDVQKKVNDLWQNLLHPAMPGNETDGMIYATCEMKPSSKIDADKPQVTGQVLFRQHYSHGRLEAIFYLDGFPLDNNQSGRAIHIHELGDLSNGCDSTGGHYNPFGVNHPPVTQGILATSFLKKAKSENTKQISLPLCLVHIPSWADLL